ncbi:(deoxy)nucleoside triphosphate pyrophosphohydrolase [Companilactobacillus pabuli]|jgi:8-oxo-dGTP diphosphatase|uniref:8-oxo-dGTP diphosphatase n=1 Tax=Companilactobacillus pabuli TaxID=2714036 RepID=A0A7L7KZN5_9LACO|nr:(deoxy)nucleoside triphosphate pyrophosphohydrolase [Companilactobacillus pabuli]AKP03059.1 7,8-dihydro-8-oxoguanine-triphosphatase [Companilactobacillus farciminis]AKS51359.1 7,8-dihydro-8-oxoguanine-triphosphatase [Companilactobacillus farciminis]MDG5112146.1 (deoxy)nucleoside triphosphate pyrophosphohydrolase [Companilactobacillus pabuli]QMT85257.1 (deoxy)nucleoside triphosphate pyrophosphohydrolase [Companilactobacillus pabuli]GAQ02274.1 7,8-dihydro-8-oxoguanine-triphosphatase [Companil
MGKIQVVGAIIIKDHKLLAAQRASNRVLGGYWEFPGGKIEPSETPEAAMSRELKEEFGAKATVFEKFSIDGIAELEFGEVILHCYYVRLDSNISKTIAHDELRWVTPDEALALDWAPSDVAVIKALAKTGFNYEY